MIGPHSNFLSNPRLHTGWIVINNANRQDIMHVSELVCLEPLG